MAGLQKIQDVVYVDPHIFMYYLCLKILMT